MRKIIFTFIFTVLVALAFSQSYTIKGNVMGLNNEELYGYNVILLHPRDTSFYKGDFFIDSKFSIETSELPVFVKITSMGFDDKLFLVEKTQLDRC